MIGSFHPYTANNWHVGAYRDSPTLAPPTTATTSSLSSSLSSSFSSLSISTRSTTSQSVPSSPLAGSDSPITPIPSSSCSAPSTPPLRSSHIRNLLPTTEELNGEWYCYACHLANPNTVSWCAVCGTRNLSKRLVGLHLVSKT